MLVRVVALVAVLAVLGACTPDSGVFRGKPAVVSTWS